MHFQKALATVGKGASIAKIGPFVKKHNAEIYIGLGAGLLVGGAITAVFSTPKAMMMVSEKEHEILENPDDARELGKGKLANHPLKMDLTVPEVIGATWKVYLPSALMCAGGVALLILSGVTSNKKIAALSAAYALSENALSEYKHKATEVFGKDADKIKDKILEDKVKENPPSKVQTDIPVIDNGGTLIYEPYSGQYFRSDIETVKKAVNVLNDQINHGEEITMNDLLDAIGLKGGKICDLFSWRSGELIELYLSSQLAENDEPCIVLDFYQLPKLNADGI